MVRAWTLYYGVCTRWIKLYIILWATKQAMEVISWKQAAIAWCFTISVSAKKVASIGGTPEFSVSMIMCLKLISTVIHQGH